MESQSQGEISKEEELNQLLEHPFASRLMYIVLCGIWEHLLFSGSCGYRLHLRQLLSNRYSNASFACRRRSTVWQAGDVTDQRDDPSVLVPDHRDRRLKSSLYPATAPLSAKLLKRTEK